MDALSGDRELLGRARAKALSGDVHSVFKRVVNIRPADGGEIYCIAASSLDDAPHAIRIPIASFQTLQIHRRMRVRYGEGRLLIGSALEIALCSARLWSGRLPTLGTQPLPLTWLGQLVRTRGRVGGIVAGASQDSVGRAITRALNERASGLWRALAIGDDELAYEHGGGLVGLGPGLTPAGDDYLLGLVIACVMRGRAARPRLELLRRIAIDHGARTNAISRAAISHGFAGRARERIVCLGEALRSGDRMRMLACSQQVIAIGGSSGTDTLCGVLAGLALPQLR